MLAEQGGRRAAVGRAGSLPRGMGQWAMAITRPDQDRLADLVAVDDHARKLVGRKAEGDRKRFEQLTSRPLSLKETAVAAVGVVLVLSVLVAVLTILLK